MDLTTRMKLLEITALRERVGFAQMLANKHLDALLWSDWGRLSTAERRGFEHKGLVNAAEFILGTAATDA